MVEQKIKTSVLSRKSRNEVIIVRGEEELSVQVIIKIVLRYSLSDILINT
jgi:hypothetical protein